VGGVKALIFNAGKLLRKISIFGATECQILMLECTKFDFRWGSATDPAYSVPEPVAAFKGPTFKGKEGNSKERRREGKGGGKGG